MASRILMLLGTVAAVSSMSVRVMPSVQTEFGMASATVGAEERVAAPLVSNGWKITERTTGDVRFTIVVARQNMDQIKQIALEVSDPRNPKYGDHLSQDEIDALTAPLLADMTAVKNWLIVHRITDFTMDGTHHIDVVCPVAVAEELLTTTWHRLENEKTQQVVHRAAAYTVPSSVAGSIAAFFSVHGLPLPPKVLLGAPKGQPYKVTPEVIATKYGVDGVKASGNSKNIQAVAEFQGQYMIPKNLKTFFAQYVKNAADGDDVVSKFVGDPDEKTEGIEADLDIQYIMGVAPGVVTQFWEEKGDDFCKDLIKWSNLLLTTDFVPLVNSISYGWQGPMEQIQCKANEYKEVDNNFAVLAAKGVSIIFASGDSGSGYQEGAEVEAKQKLYPSWPASSPWVTAVGGTRFVDQDPTAAEMATDQFGSGGGFSSMIDRTNATWQESFVTAYLANAPGLPPKGAFAEGGRATPDVSGLAEGYQVIDHGAKADSVGGTSASTPMFSGIVSLLNDARMAKGMKPLGFLNPFLYQNPKAFTDVTKGTNAIGRDGSKVPQGFECTRGWDAATGLGTPIFKSLLAAATGGPVPPSPPSPPPSPPSPPSPPPPSPPSPPSPGSPKYEDPNNGPCQHGETAVQITGIKGSFCSPKCELFRICPKDVPAGTTAEPKCVLETSGSTKPTQCALICTPSALADGCPTKASCKSISGTGICTYDE